MLTQGKILVAGKENEECRQYDRSGHNGDREEQYSVRANHDRDCDGHDINAESVYQKANGSASYILPKTSVPLVPPKPNEFFTAMLIGISRATFAQ